MLQPARKALHFRMTVQLAADRPLSPAATKASFIDPRVYAERIFRRQYILHLSMAAAVIASALALILTLLLQNCCDSIIVWSRQLSDEDTATILPINASADASNATVAASYNGTKTRFIYDWLCRHAAATTIRTICEVPRPCTR